MPGQLLCPYCAAEFHQTSCNWTVRPWTEANAPDRLFFRSSEQVFRGVQGQPMQASPAVTLGASYSLVGVSYHVGPSHGVRNHFVSQIRLRGRWHHYDCLNGGILTSSDSFDHEWHASSLYILVYMRTSLCIAAPAAYGQNQQQNHSAPGSPSGRQDEDVRLAISTAPGSPSRRQDGNVQSAFPTSTSGLYRAGQPVSPSGRTE